MGGTIDIDCDADGRGRCSSGSGDGFHNSYGADSRGYSGNSSVGGYPSGGRTSGDGYSGTMSSGGGVGSSYVATNHDLRIRNVYKALADGEEWKPGAYYGCSADNTRKNKETNGLSSNLVYTVNEIKIYSGFHPVKGFVFSDCNLTARDMEYLSSNLPSINHTFELVDFSYNPQIGPLGLDHLIKGAHGIVSLQSGNHDINLMYQGMLTRPGFNTVKLDLSNCNIGDIGADILGHALASGKLPATKEINVSGNQITDNGSWSIAEALKTGKFPTLKRFDASGNDISLVGEKFMLDAIKHPSTQSVMVILKRSDNLKTVLSGSKEDKQKLIKETLQMAQDNGVDVKNVAVSKGISGFLDNLGYVISDFALGFTKCNIVPEDATSLAADVITAKISKKAIAATTTKDAVVCLFDTVEEVSTSPEGVQFIKDLDLCGANSVIDSIE